MKMNRNLLSAAAAFTLTILSTLAFSHSAMAADNCVNDPTGPGNPNAFDPLTLRRMNGLAAVKNCGAGQTIAVVIGGINNLKADLTTYSKTYGLPIPNDDNFQIVAPDGHCYQSGKPLESHIDAEMVHAFAPQAKIIVACPGDATIQGMARAITAAIDNGASVVSMSWGAPENQNAINTLEWIFSEYYWVTFVAASGDSGANLDANGTPRVAYPASSPNVLAVGATQDWGGQDVYAWGNTGGGFSKFFARPDWQTGVTNISQNARLVPDIAINGAKESPVSIVSQGNWVGAAGSSVSAPIAAGIIALAVEKRGDYLGDVHDKLYRVFNRGQQTKYFRDVIYGDNGYYGANEGFDLVSGLGTPRGFNLINFLSRAY